MDGRGGRGRGNGITRGGDRNRRMFAALQSALGGPSRVSGSVSNQSGPRTRLQAKREKEKAEQLDSLDDVISQIADLNIRCDRSAMQIKRNIEACGYLEDMDELEWEKLCQTLCDTALKESETDFVVDLFASLLGHPVFCDVMCCELARISSTYIMEGGSDDSIPQFLARILCGNWPRGATRALESSNPILFTTLSIVQGWLIVLNTSDKEIKAPSPSRRKMDFEEESDKGSDEDDRSSISSLDTSGDEAGPSLHTNTASTDDADAAVDEQPTVEEDEKAPPEVVNRCALAVSALCHNAQRSLWMKWPTLCDDIYAAIKPAITHSLVLSGDTKGALLSTLIALHAWTKAKAATTRCAHTQTVN